MDAMSWYQDVTNGDSVNAVALKAGLIQSTLNRQVRAEALAPESMVAIARAYGSDVLDALMVAGLITREDIRAHGARVTLRDVLDAEIAGEVSRRLGGGFLDAPLS